VSLEGVGAHVGFWGGCGPEGGPLDASQGPVRKGSQGFAGHPTVFWFSQKGNTTQNGIKPEQLLKSEKGSGVLDRVPKGRMDAQNEEWRRTPD